MSHRQPQTDTDRRKKFLIDVKGRVARRVDVRWLRQQVRAAAEIQAITAGRWAIELVDDERMCVMHERTMGIPTTTDVLTFDMREEEGEGALDLDTMICVDEAARRAEEFGHGLGEEVLLYAVHSLLHVCGYDDVTKAKAARMHKREDEILEAIGVGRLYAPRREMKRSLR